MGGSAELVKRRHLGRGKGVGLLKRGQKVVWTCTGRPKTALKGVGAVFQIVVEVRGQAKMTVKINNSSRGEGISSMLQKSGREFCWDCLDLSVCLSPKHLLKQFSTVVVFTLPQASTVEKICIRK